MANEFQHKDPGSELTQAEYITTDGTGHIFDCQATGDIMYASSATVLKNLGKGAANTVLSMGGSCIPAWTASPSVTDLTIGGGCITLSAATDIDLLDNNASALSFDATGKTGIIDIVTTNCSEGVTMSGTLGVTGVVTASAGVVIDNVTYDACTITATAAFTVDATTDIVLDADGDNITFKAGSGDTTGLDFSNSSGTWTVKAGTSDSDLIFQVNDGGTTNTVLTLDGGDSVVYLGGNATKAGELRILEDSDAGCHYAAIKVQNMAASYTLTLPADDGCCGEALTTNGSGTLTWAAGGVGCGPLRISNGAACAPAYSFSGDTNSGFYHTGTADTIELIAGGGGSLRLDSDSKVFIKETANGSMGRGLTIQQGGYDNEILAFKSCDVAHGIGQTETDTYGAFKKANPTAGGLMIRSWQKCGETIGMHLQSNVLDNNESKSTSAKGNFTLDARKGTDNGPVDDHANANLVVFWSASNNARFIFDTEGSGHADVEFTTYDDYNDIELLRGVHGALVPCYREQFGQDMTYNLSTYQDMGLIGKCSVHWEDRKDGRHQLRGMVNFTQLAMLHHSTIIQMHDQLTARLDGMETQIKTLSEGK